MRAFGVLELLIAIIYICLHYNISGYFFFIDIGKIGFLIWIITMGLYNISISSLLKPNIFINVVSLLILSNFYFISKLNLGILSSLKRTIIEMNGIGAKKYFDGGITILFFLGFMATIITYIRYGFPLLNSNHLVRTPLAMGYFFESLVVVCIYSYISIRSRGKRERKLWSFVLFCLSLIFLSLRMNRGSFFFVIFGIIIYEILNYYEKKKKKYLSPKAMASIMVVAILFIVIFGKLGDMRTSKVISEVYHTTYMERSGMPVNFPSGLGQIYLYLTTPIENASYTLQNQTIKNPTLLNSLLYPFIKLLANMVGLGDEYATYVRSSVDTIPVLWSQAGFNATSFMTAAYQDLDLIGIPVYLLFFDLIIIFVSRVLKSKLRAISKLIIYSLLIQTILWSVFQNSAFHIAAIWVDTFFVACFDWANRKVKILGINFPEIRLGIKGGQMMNHGEID